MNLFKKQVETPRVLITGGSGFIGGALIRRILKETECLIFNIDKMSYVSSLESINNILKNIGDDNSSRFNLLEIDLSNSSKTEDAIAFSNPDLVFHLAAESHVDRSISGPEIFINSNIIGTFNLLESVKKHFNNLSTKRKESFRFLHISTDEVFGSLGQKGYFNEFSQYDPRSPYSASKSSSDHLVNAWHHTFGLPTITTNCSNNYGPWQYPEKLIPKIIMRAINPEKIPIYGDGENIRDWLFVSDHVDGLIKVINDGNIGEKYCIGGNEEKTNNEIVNIVCEILDKVKSRETSYKNLITYVEDRLGHDQRYAIDSSKIKSKLGWEPTYSFDEGIQITVKWYLENLNFLINS